MVLIVSIVTVFQYTVNCISHDVATIGCSYVHSVRDYTNSIFAICVIVAKSK
jgi:hypothetical protein